MSRKYFSILTPLLFFILSLNLYAQLAKSESELLKYLDAKEKKYEEICVEFGTNTWNMYSMEGKSDISLIKQKFGELYNDKDLKANINAWADKLKDNSNKNINRRLAVWKNILDAAQVEYDPEVSKISGALLEEVRNRDMKNRQQTLEIENKVLNLIKLRNKKAVEAGYNNYGEFILEKSGLGIKWFNEFTRELENRSGIVYKELFDKLKNEKGTVSIKDIMQIQKYYDEPQFSNDSLYIMMKETLANIGVDYSKLPIRFVVKEADFGGNCIAVSIPEDLRVIMVPNMPISVYLHELGHGLQWMKCEINSPILEGYEWCLGNGGPAFAEGMAETLANFCRQSPWYKKYSKFSDQEITNMMTPDKFGSAVNIRQTLYGFLIELEIYKNPEKNIKEISSELFKRLFLVDDFVPPFSLANTMYVDYPCYMHNYLIANIIGWQVHDALKKNFGADYVFNKTVGGYLIDNLYKNGMLKPWREILKGATGKDFDLDGYLKSLGL